MNANYCNANVQVVQYVVVMEGRWMVCLSLDAKYVKYKLQSINEIKTIVNIKNRGTDVGVRQFLTI